MAEASDDTEAAAEDTEASDDTEASNGDLLAALLFAAEVEASSDGAGDLYRQYLTQVFPCLADGYVEIFGDQVEPPYDAATVRANAENGQSLSLSLVERSSMGPDAHVASLDAEVACFDGVYGAKQWDVAFQVSDGFQDGSASDWLGYAACILDAVEPTEAELVASHYYWYYDSGATDGPLGDPTSYFDLSSDLQARWSRAHGDSSSLGDPCMPPV